MCDYWGRPFRLRTLRPSTVTKSDFRVMILNGVLALWYGLDQSALRISRTHHEVHSSSVHSFAFLAIILSPACGRSFLFEAILATRFEVPELRLIAFGTSVEKFMLSRHSEIFVSAVYDSGGRDRDSNMSFTTCVVDRVSPISTPVIDRIIDESPYLCVNKLFGRKAEACICLLNCPLDRVRVMKSYV